MYKDLILTAGKKVEFGPSLLHWDHDLRWAKRMDLSAFGLASKYHTNITHLALHILGISVRKYLGISFSIFGNAISPSIYE